MFPPDNDDPGQNNKSRAADCAQIGNFVEKDHPKHNRKQHRGIIKRRNNRGRRKAIGRGQENLPHPAKQAANIKKPASCPVGKTQPNGSVKSERLAEVTEK